MQTKESSEKLDRTLGPLMLWGLGVGYVISGMYFGWNLGLPEGGTLGLAIATVFISIMYLCFTFSYTELACLYPKAGGAFVYAHEALGSNLGFITGLAQIIEFVFAPPAIAAAIGAYFSIFFKEIPPIYIGIIAYVIFTVLNIIGIKSAARFELIITILAVVELLIFASMTLPHFSMHEFTLKALPNGWAGVFRAIPFAIWFFLAIEGLANVAEETINPQKNMLFGFSSAILTLLGLCALVFFASIGIAGWEAVVYPYQGADASDSPLPLALSHLIAKDHFLYHLLVTIGVFGLLASFHGIILAAGRASFEFGRVGYAPALLGRVHPYFKTPAWALLLNMFFGILALCTGKTGEIITLSCFGALSLYILAMLSLLKIRQKFPSKKSSFRVPFYPFTPLTALVIASIAFLSMTYYNPYLCLIYVTIMSLAFILFKLFIIKPDTKLEL